MNARRARRRKHEKRLLRDYRTGGVQTTALRQLVRDARADGLRPFLYALPVTELHRAFFEDDGYAAFLAHAKRVAAEEGVPFVDLDTGHALGHDAFHDTDHLHRSASRKLSARFAREAVLPLVGD